MLERAAEGSGGQSVFGEALAGILKRTPGARAAALVARDGVLVHREGAGANPDIMLVSAHLTDLLRKASAAGEECGVGPTVELIQKTASHAFVLRAVTAEYCLLVVLARHASIGRARWELLKATEILRGELV